MGLLHLREGPQHIGGGIFGPTLVKGKMNFEIYGKDFLLCQLKVNQSKIPTKSIFKAPRSLAFKKTMKTL